MARAALKARFFVRPDGVAIVKAPPLTPAERRAIYERDGKVCRYCGTPVTWFRKHSTIFSTTRPAAVDHVFPRARGGQNDDTNLVLACESCNAAKGAY